MDAYTSDLRQLISQSRTGSVPSTTPDDTTLSNTVIIDDEEDEEVRAEDIFVGFYTQFHPWAFYLGLLLFKFTQQHQGQSLTVVLDSISAANLLESAQLVEDEGIFDVIKHICHNEINGNQISVVLDDESVL